MEKEIAIEKYLVIDATIQSLSTEEEVIEVHKNLIGKTTKGKYYEIKDCGVDLVEKIIQYDSGSCQVVEYSDAIKKFIKSKYLSDYFKENIKELLSQDGLNEDVKKIIESDKNINDMSEEEIKYLNNAIENFYSTERITKPNISSEFMPYIYKLDGEGIISFIKNNINSQEIAKRILGTSGLCPRSSYYSGRGVNRGDLNESQLIEIFKKLYKLDHNYSLEFFDMVNEMKSLGATEFIDTFYNFARNGFSSKRLDIKTSNISVEGLYDEARNMMMFISILEVQERMKTGRHEDSVTASIKGRFNNSVMPIIKELRPNYSFDSQYDEIRTKLKRI